MNSAIKIGNEITKQSSESLIDLIKTVFEVGKANGMEQETIRRALQLIENVSEVKNVNVTNSHFIGDKVVHMDNNPMPANESTNDSTDY